LNPDWIDENELITDDDTTFDEVVLMPTTMKSVKVLTRFSNELARQSVVALDAVVKARLVKDVADKIDNAFIAGTSDTGTIRSSVSARSSMTIPASTSGMMLAWHSPRPSDSKPPT
jgi:HK97 family phage major capsid protein